MLLANRFRGVSSSPHPYRRDDETTSRIEGVSRTFKGARTRIVSEVSGVRTQCFDYVIVGGGSAGCVLAARFSGDPTVKVALIEAGPPDDASEIHTPQVREFLSPRARGTDTLVRYLWRRREDTHPITPSAISSPVRCWARAFDASRPRAAIPAGHSRDRSSSARHRRGCHRRARC